MARFNRLQPGPGASFRGTEPAIGARVQTSTQDGLDALERSALGPASQNGAAQASNGVLTPRRTIKQDKPTLIPHKLGRPYRGWNVALKNQGVSFFCPSGEQYDKSKFICVQFPSGGPTEAEAEFWVF